jgi:hypothetical protein
MEIPHMQATTQIRPLSSLSQFCEEMSIDRHTIVYQMPKIIQTTHHTHFHLDPLPNATNVQHK